MKLEELRRKARERPRALPERFELPPDMGPLYGLLFKVESEPLGIRRSKHATPERDQLEMLEKLRKVVLTANGYYMITNEGRHTAAICRRHQRSVETNILPMIKVPTFK